MQKGVFDLFFHIALLPKDPQGDEAKMTTVSE